MRILVALDSFKGTLGAGDACRLVARTFDAHPAVTACRCLPMADGGEGTAETMAAALGGHMASAGTVSGPLPGQTVEAGYAWMPDRKLAVVEMASASGLPLVPANRRDPRVATTYGTGQILAAAACRGPASILLTLGGSATVDGGTGAAAALGWRFLDAAGTPLPRGGAALRRLARIVPPPTGSPLPPLRALCDVDSPLCGADGAAAVYGPQKGATPDMVSELDEALARLAARIRADLGSDVATVPGAGAAGGFGAGALAFLGATLAPGADTVARSCDLPAELGRVDWVVTGEGRFDRQSLQGKVVSAVCRFARQAGARVAVLAGQIALRADAYRSVGVELAEAAAPQGQGEPSSHAACVRQLEAAARRLIQSMQQA